MDQKVKQLRAEITDKQILVDGLKERIRHEQREADKKQQKINEMKKYLHNLETPMRISDHAIVRYLERKYNLDIEQIKEEILPKNIENMANELGSGKFPVNNGNHSVVIKDNTVVTVIDRE